MISGLALVCALAAIAIFLRSLGAALWDRDEEVPVEGLKTMGRRWLEANGYELVRRSEGVTHVTRMASAQWSGSLRPDFIARKEGREYAVFVRTEPVSEQELHERYALVALLHGASGVIVIDVMQESVQTAVYEWNRPRHVRRKEAVRRVLWALGGALVALIAWKHG
ncbi:hypothetical protein [Alicyclobacillus acidocaldarius]|uniref:Uncharacterized protein n=1 Tax=Alicyclobacillus acidocaldarius subsp. acidocaldarius (strain ATCC 27009 / DSM 446 / BCRC 14685 / JCM 5260 / KCTC 1825 / NBRC 15652 / NCIMB 11725 / NRRL B-14509 / 104-IA) TaxID=521098 RepID=C8WXG2_ALIAD|nr:hypothetical protein [Alicyclobacillus acidocaldarius]ACV58783.1 hypothetical protein Aaci_1771 [Alicyclobacillus acidocaldarius subsp. acidocaldarius DSM 446]